ncbi:MAG: hypothetical protein ACOCY0_02785 [Roseicyclus sp.]
MTRVAIALLLCLGLAACGQSRLNPMTWFGGEREERITLREGAPESADPRPLVAAITALSVETTTSGAIVTATALTDATGYWQPGLLEVERTEDSVTYEFRARPPQAGRLAGPEPTRVIVAAVDLGRRDLAGLRTITVRSQTNQRSVQRR